MFKGSTTLISFLRFINFNKLTCRLITVAIILASPLAFSGDRVSYFVLVEKTSVPASDAKFGHEAHHYRFSNIIESNDSPNGTRLADRAKTFFNENKAENDSSGLNLTAENPKIEYGGNGFWTIEEVVVYVKNLKYITKDGNYRVQRNAVDAGRYVILPGGSKTFLFGNNKDIALQDYL